MRRHELPRTHAAGRTYLVTGSTSGIGYFIAEQLARTGAHVILTARTAGKAELAQRAIRHSWPQAQLSTLSLDLADLSSVRAAAGHLATFADRLDGVVLNAGVLAQQTRRETVDGHELVYGTNHLGHFAFAAQIYPLLQNTLDSRIVTMSSYAARWATLDLTDLESSRAPYRGFATYKRSKLAQTIFAFELDRRLRRGQSSVSSLLAHPGGALDALSPKRPPMPVATTAQVLRARPLSLIAQGKDKAAWSAVRAVLDPQAHGGQLWGPRFLRSKGEPRQERPTAAMTDRVVAEQLWQLSEDATGVKWPSLSQPRRL
ncbi:hypothetical protein BST13_25780 [Mycobacterium aquaticum]|uniref:Ketoreductase domain-containing protein n=1 Tax=Mycobacterium aquaticum TaxID=1927124 RepID=A0A1X0AN20_9MYCO|nr:hypothetical protein BST13_25780 [Mycobacterium aquaticum]